MSLEGDARDVVQRIAQQAPLVEDVVHERQEGEVPMNDFFAQELARQHNADLAREAAHTRLAAEARRSAAVTAEPDEDRPMREVRTGAWRPRRWILVPWVRGAASR